MKKAVSVLLVLIMALSMASCSVEKKSEEISSSETVSSAVSQTSSPTEEITEPKRVPLFKNDPPKLEKEMSLARSQAQKKALEYLKKDKCLGEETKYTEEGIYTSYVRSDSTVKEEELQYYIPENIACESMYIFEYKIKATEGTKASSEKDCFKIGVDGVNGKIVYHSHSIGEKRHDYTDDYDAHILSKISALPDKRNIGLLEAMSIAEKYARQQKWSDDIKYPEKMHTEYAVYNNVTEIFPGFINDENIDKLKSKWVIMVIVNTSDDEPEPIAAGVAHVYVDAATGEIFCTDYDSD